MLLCRAAIDEVYTNFQATDRTAFITFRALGGAEAVSSTGADEYLDGRVQQAEVILQKDWYYGQLGLPTASTFAADSGRNPADAGGSPDCHLGSPGSTRPRRELQEVIGGAAAAGRSVQRTTNGCHSTVWALMLLIRRRERESGELGSRCVQLEGPSRQTWPAAS